MRITTKNNKMNCQLCGIEFFPKRPATRKFCSSKCRCKDAVIRQHAKGIKYQKALLARQDCDAMTKLGRDIMEKYDATISGVNIHDLYICFKKYEIDITEYL